MSLRRVDFVILHKVCNTVAYRSVRSIRTGPIEDRYVWNISRRFLTSYLEAQGTQFTLIYFIRLLGKSFLICWYAEWERHLSFLGESRAAFGSIDELKYVLVHSSNNLAVKSIRDKKKFLGFLKSCLAFSEVTIPSISDSIQRMNLYLETAEVISS
ncbi:hypothetical protein GW17_00032174 [Ensete ventricosum]|nr:hypothetical protein GW17_00032174 [Ensete ventricosum]